MKNPTIRSLVGTIALTGLLATTVQAQTVKHATSVEQLKKIIAENEFVIVDVYQVNCPPCGPLSKTLDKLAPMYNDVVIVKVNYSVIGSSSISILGQSIKTTPTIVFLHNGEKVLFSTSDRSLTQLKNKIKDKFDVA